MVSYEPMKTEDGQYYPAGVTGIIFCSIFEFWVFNIQFLLLKIDSRWLGVNCNRRSSNPLLGSLRNRQAKRPIVFVPLQVQ